VGVDNDRNRSELVDEPTAAYLRRWNVIECVEGAAVSVIPREFRRDIVWVLFL
jgi:hypothetical protein